MTAATVFEPARYLSRLNGKDYLEVKWRLVWLRDRHPGANVDTQLVELTEDKAVFKATIEIPEGGRATGYGSETERDFRDFLEKAETKAIGRALAALGFGTQFCDDHNFGASEGRVVDAPVSQPGRAQPRDSAPAPARAPVAPPRQEPAQTGRIAAGQQQAIIRMCDELGYTTEDRIAADFNKGSLSMLTQEEAGDLITALDKELRAHRAQLRMMADSPTESSHFATA
jgi:hypothetical protein